LFQSLAGPLFPTSDTTTRQSSDLPELLPTGSDTIANQPATVLVGSHANSNTTYFAGLGFHDEPTFQAFFVRVRDADAGGEACTGRVKCLWNRAKLRVVMVDKSVVTTATVPTAGV